MNSDAADLDALVPGLDDLRRTRLLALRDIYADWNEKINLISRKDFAFFHERHLLHSLSLAPFLNADKAKTVIDIGTGGGFPGIPLAIAFPDIQFTLVDSIAKKIKVVEAVAEELELDNVRAIRSRAEHVDGHYDYAVTRAVARLRMLVQYCIGSRMTADRLLCLKGGNLEDELREIKRHPVEVYPLRDTFAGEFFETKKVVLVDFQGRRLRRP